MDNNQVTNKAPSLSYLLLEGRMIIEWVSSCALYPLIPKQVEGESRPVLIFPPFLGNDVSTTFLRKYLNNQGFKAYKWDVGVNFVRDNYLPQLEEKLTQVYEKHGQKVALIGWSAGGIFARVLANLFPEMTEQVITIATPFKGIRSGKTNVDTLFEIFNGKKKSQTKKELLDLIEKTPDTPVTCLYSTTDGIVQWEHCYEEVVRENINNIEVFGSHAGLGANPSVMIYVAQALGSKSERPAKNMLPGGIANVLYPQFWKLDKKRV